MLALMVVLGLRDRYVEAQGTAQSPRYRFDPSWPKPQPSVKDAEGVMRAWASGAVGTHCVDSRDHIFQFNRSYLNPSEYTKILTSNLTERGGTIPAPPVIEFDPEGNIVNTWGYSKLTRTATNKDASAVLPQSTHGCSVDYEDNVWVAGNADGVVQKWTHDGKKMLLQIGTKGICDGLPTLSPQSAFPTCGSPGNNDGRTLLNEPSNVAVDPNPDPVTGERGSVYISDGYGNHRVVVFNSTGQYLRQWGSSGTGPGQFAPDGGGHPHCVKLGNDGLVYVCDRQNSRIEIFDKLGNLKKVIAVSPPEDAKGPVATVCDIAFSRDPEQRLMYVADLGGGRVNILARDSGKIIGSIGGPGPAPGEFMSAHSIAVDSKGTVYVGESPGGQHTQKFVKVSN
jgi:outer membrane protein assembly factor BamB